MNMSEMGRKKFLRLTRLLIFFVVLSCLPLNGGTREGERKQLREMKKPAVIKIDKRVVPVRIHEEIHSPDTFLKTIENQAYSGEIISVDFKNADIRIVIEQFAAVLVGYPLEVAPDIEGKVSFRQINTPWNRVLSTFLKQFSLEIIFDGDRLLVRSRGRKTGSIFLFLIPMLSLLTVGSVLLRRKWTRKNRKKIPSSLSAISPRQLDEYMKRITYMLEVEKIFHDEDLSLGTLAEKLALQPYVVSKIINEKLNRSFPELLNASRIEEAKRLLIEDSGNKTILDIAFEVGYKSKTAFNRSFKRLVGKTPSQYRKTHVS